MSRLDRLLVVPLAVVLAAPPAAAQSPAASASPLTGTPTTDAARPKIRVLVIPRREGDPLPPATDASLRESIRDGLRRAGAGLLEAAAVGVTQDCSDDACRARLRALGLRYVVRPTLVTVDRDYALRVELVDLRDGSSAGVYDERCSLCGLAEARERVAQGAADLIARRLEPQKQANLPTLQVITDPPGAQVTIDGTLAGPAPLERPLAAGEHTVDVALPGYRSVVRPVPVVDGQRHSLHLSLAPAQEPGPPPRRGRVLLGVGIPIVLGGLVLVGLDHAIVPFGCAPEGPCRGRLGTSWPAALTLATGTVLTTIGAVLVHQARRRARRPR